MKGSYRLLLLFLSLFIIVSSVSAITVTVSVFEKADNITPLQTATVFVNGALAGKTGADGIFSFTHPGTDSIQVKVMKPGYDSFDEEIGMAENAVLVQLKKKHLNLAATIYDTDSAVPVTGAKVRLTAANMSEITNTTDQTGRVVFPVEAGNVYNIEISAPNYQDRMAIVEMGMEDKNIQYLLIKDDRFSIHVLGGQDQNPVADAEVQIDGVSKGKTDQRGILTLEIPRNKVYNIRILKTGYTDYTEKRMIGENEAVVTTVLSVAPYKASVNVFDENKVPVDSASVLVDGKVVGTTNSYGKYTFENVPSGRYLLEIRHTGYVSARKDIGPDDSGKDIIIELPLENADLTIFAEDDNHNVLPGAIVSLNGKTTGATDDNGVFTAKVKVNTPYNVTAAKQGYRPVSVVEQVKSGNATKSVTLTLEKEINTGIFLLGGLVIIAIVIIVLLVLRHGRRGRPKSTHGSSKNHPPGHPSGGKKDEI